MRLYTTSEVGRKINTRAYFNHGTSGEEMIRFGVRSLEINRRDVPPRSFYNMLADSGEGRLDLL